MVLDGPRRHALVPVGIRQIPGGTFLSVGLRLSEEMPVEVTGGGELVADGFAYVQQNPVLVGLGVVVATIVLVAVGYVVRRVRRTPGDRFVDALVDRNEVTVLMHPNPDPDAIACAVAVEHLANDVGTETTLLYPGQIRHQENRAMETILDLDLERIEQPGDLVDGAVVLVDHNEPRGFVGAESVDPYAIVDHHPGSGEGSAFTDIRTNYGACASILAEYLRGRGWTADGDRNHDEMAIPSSLATALMYGIQADTRNLTRGCSSWEFEAASFLYPAVDPDSLERIATPPVDGETLEVKARAIHNLDHQRSFVVSNVGVVSNVDAIAQAAEELLRLEGVTAVVVAGEKDGMLHLSGRSRDDRVHMGKALRAVVSDIPMSDAGGHARMGGGQVSVQHMQGLGPGDGFGRDELTRRMFAALTGDV